MSTSLQKLFKQFSAKIVKRQLLTQFAYKMFLLKCFYKKCLQNCLQKSVKKNCLKNCIKKLSTKILPSAIVSLTC